MWEESRVGGILWEESCRRNPMWEESHGEESHLGGIPWGRNPVWEESHGGGILFGRNPMRGIPFGRNPGGRNPMGGIPWEEFCMGVIPMDPFILLRLLIQHLFLHSLFVIKKIHLLNTEKKSLFFPVHISELGIFNSLTQYAQTNELCFLQFCFMVLNNS